MYSYDIFDTLITRKTANPFGIFSLIQEKLITNDSYSIPEHIKENFYDIRINAERLAREHNSSRLIEEVSLIEIYTALALAGGLNDRQIQLLYKLEIQTEKENIIGIEENIEKVRFLIDKGEQVVLISDMYLSERVIRDILVDIDLMFQEIPIYVSSELKKRKTSGNLYRKIKAELGIDYGNWMHIGDNLHQDIEIAYRLGIKVQHYNKNGLNDFELDLLNHYGNNHVLQLEIGAAVNAIRRNKLTTIASRIGCRYSGPILYNYAQWLLSECDRKDIKRLYFIARDGYLVKKIVDLIITHKKLDIKTHYIYGSRRAWRIPSLSRENYNLKQILHWSHIEQMKSIEEFADVLMITPEELKEFLPCLDSEENEPISSAAIVLLAQQLGTNKRFKEYILNRHKDKRKLLEDYIQQEVDYSDDRFAFVDISGGGLTQGCLKNIMQPFYKKPIRSFFFKIDRVNLVDNCIYDVYIPSFLENNIVLEMICRAPEGQTMGYMKKENSIIAIKENIQEKEIIKNDFFDYQLGIECFTKQMLTYQKKKRIKTNRVDMILKYINHIAISPEKEVLEFFATMPNSETGREKVVVEYAPKLSKKDIENIFLKRSNELLSDFYKGTNLNYSILRCDQEELKYIEQCKAEYNSARGLLARQDKIIKERLLWNKYGLAWWFPTEVLEKHVAIYGAGRYGQALYKKIKSERRSTVVVWVDKNYHQSQKEEGIKVTAPETLLDTSYDYIIIAVKDIKIKKEIKNELLDMGIQEEKVLWNEW